MSCIIIWTVIWTIWWTAMGHQWPVDHSLKYTVLAAITRRTRQKFYIMHAIPDFFIYTKIVCNLNYFSP